MNTHPSWYQVFPFYIATCKPDCTTQLTLTLFFLCCNKTTWSHITVNINSFLSVFQQDILIAQLQEQHYQQYMQQVYQQQLLHQQQQFQQLQVIRCSNVMYGWCINTLRPRQNGRHLSYDIFRWIFLNENVWIPIKISLKIIPKGPINNIPALDQIMAWRRPGDKPLYEPMMVRLPMHICVTRPQWVNSLVPGRFEWNLDQ